MPTKKKLTKSEIDDFFKDFEAKLPLAIYTVRIMPPRADMTDEEMDAALRTLRATLEHDGHTKGRMNLEALIYHAYFDCIDNLGAAGFTVEVESEE